MHFFILDERNVWFEAAIAAAKNRGHTAQRIQRGSQILAAPPSDVGFIRPHARPEVLERNQEDYRLMCNTGITMIQDPYQMAVYEDKSTQWEYWSKWMPPTWRFVNLHSALEFAEKFPENETIVSKADEGASSVNVRIIRGRQHLIEHVRKIFERGISVNPCADTKELLLQNDYVLLQQFIPHTTTWRVNVIGTRIAGFMRYCYPDKPVAQTGNTDPIMEMTPQVESLFEFSRQVAKDIGTKWCAFDILDDNGTWRLIETSLAWPWPGVGKQAPFFGTSRHWGEMWEVMFDELEAGVWNE